MLNNDDIETLMTALDEYEKSFTRDGLIGSILTMAFMGDKEKAIAESEKEMEKAASKQRDVKEKIILLKAKLISMKDKEAVSEASEFLRRGQ